MKNGMRAIIAAVLALAISDFANAGGSDLPPDRITSIWDLLLRTLGL